MSQILQIHILKFFTAAINNLTQLINIDIIILLHILLYNINFLQNNAPTLFSGTFLQCFPFGIRPRQVTRGNLRYILSRLAARIIVTNPNGAYSAIVFLLDHPVGE